MKLSDIVITKDFVNSNPRQDKIDECRESYLKHGKLDRYIVVNQFNELIDGYILYLVLKENGVEEIPVKISNIRKRRWYRKKISRDYHVTETVYIYGKHYYQSANTFSDEYVWRVPFTKHREGWDKGLQVGDVIFVKTKKGKRPIVITKIITLDSPPIDLPIKTVVCK